MSRAHFQIVVLGSGFAGSLAAMMAHRLGFSTALIERGRHPRFAIGESSTPLANLLLEEIAGEYDLPFLRPLCKWGTWQKKFPRLACGLKRGFTFYHHAWGKPFPPDPERRRQLLVGASPNEAIADTHWYRPDFDLYLVEQAQKLGVTYWDETTLSSVSEQTGGLRLAGKRRGRSLNLTAEFVIDATGPRGCLFQALGLPEKKFPAFPRTQALFSHFRNVRPLPNAFTSEPLSAGATPSPSSPAFMGDSAGAKKFPPFDVQCSMFDVRCSPVHSGEESQAGPDGLLATQTPPYPPEQAAVHHVFPGGWIWVLKFNNGITSAGVAATDKITRDLDFKSGEPAWRKLLAQLPSLAESFGSAKAVAPFIASPSLAFRSGVVNGRHWALLPSAAGFVDPLLSTGFPLTLLGLTRLGHLLRQHWQRPTFRPQLEAYSKLTLLELDATARLVGALYATMDRFDLFKELTLLYFAAASFSETARRLGKPRLADSFLLCRHPAFGPQLRQFCATAKKALSPKAAAQLARQIRQAIEPFDVAGLTDQARHPWYPALAADLSRSAPKLGATQQEITSLLHRCGLQQ